MQNTGLFARITENRRGWRRFWFTSKWPRLKEDQIHFDLNQLKKLPNYKSYLYHWLNDYGFSAWDDIYYLVDGQSGKQIFSSEFRLLKNRDFLILSPENLDEEDEEYYVFKDQKEVNFPLNLSFSRVSEISLVSNTTIFVDEDKLWYPLVLRRWRQGDHFQPIGMDGKSKKVSKFFKDHKLSLIEKENVWIFVFRQSNCLDFGSSSRRTF